MQIDTYLVRHDCHRCGCIDESNFIRSNIHAKQVCNGCGAYVKFYSAALLPSVWNIRQKIWELTNDIRLITRVKNRLNFDSKNHYFFTYWKFYLEIRKELTHNDTNQK